MRKCPVNDGQSSLSECLGLQSDALNFSKCHINEQTCETKWLKRNSLSKSKIPRKGSKKIAGLGLGGKFVATILSSRRIFNTDGPDSDKSKLHQSNVDKQQITDTPLGLTGMTICPGCPGPHLLLC